MKLKCCSYPAAANTAVDPAVDTAVDPAVDMAGPAGYGVGPHKDYGFLAVIDQDLAGLQEKLPTPLPSVAPILLPPVAQVLAQVLAQVTEHARDA